MQHLLADCACRNNLTIIDVVTMQGQGGYGELRFSNRKPGSQKPLTFEMSDKQLKQCDSESRRPIIMKQPDILCYLFERDTAMLISFETSLPLYTVTHHCSCHLANSTKHSVMLDSGLLAPLCDNMILT